MRILRLDLVRYGPFTDKVIEFRRNARLHLVFGPNEAGKSSSLAAIGDLLFGFPKRREHDFLHEASTLRVGAEILARDGSELRFRRRRGNKKTLLAADEEEAALHEDVLSPFVGTLSREVFSRAFGINSETLREGGQAMLESEGELGAALFAAASGLTGLARIRRNLEIEADTLFAPRASKERRFYQALDRYEAAITAERRNELKAGSWKELNDQIAEVERELAAIKTRRTETNAALARLKRLKVVSPIVAAIDSLEEELTAFADLPEVSDGFVADCRRALDTAEGTGTRERIAGEEHAAAAAALAAIEVDDGAVERAEEVVELFSRKGDYLSKLEELPRLELERDEFTATLDEQAQRLGFGDIESMLDALPPEAVIETGRSLVEAGQGLEQAVEAHETRLGEELANSETQEAELSGGGLLDPKPFRDQLAALAPDLKHLEDQSYLETSLRGLRQKLKEGAMRLAPPVADVERLFTTVLPTREAIGRHKAVLERLIAEKHAEELRLEENQKQKQEAQARLTETEQSGPVAYQETIRLVRADRDQSFAILRDQLKRTGHLLAPAELAERLAQYEEEIVEADGLADQAIADAHRISRLAGYRERIAELTAQQPAIEARLNQLAGEQASAAQAYAQLFAGLDIVPTGPDGMVAWLGQVEDLAATQRDIEAIESQIAGLVGLGRQVRAALLAIAKTIGVMGADAMPPLALSRLIGATLDEMADKWSARLGFEAARQAARMRVGQIEDALNKARRTLEDWRDRYDALLPQLGLPPETGVAGAAAALVVWAAVPEAARQQAGRAARTDALQRDITAFEEEVYDLASELAPLLMHLPAHKLVDVMRERAETARAAKARQDDARTRLQAAEQRLIAAREAHDTAHATLTALAGLLPEGSDARSALVRLERRDELRTALAERRKAFEAAAEGVSEAVVREELPGYDRARAQYDAEDLERRAERLDAENDRLYALLGEKQADRARLEAGTGSELAAFERQSAEAEIVRTARQWAVRKIAATMLSTAIEKHREAQSDPLLVRAGVLFRTLTSEAFSGLLQDYGEDDLPRLVGVRKSGERVAINGMSEGTRDQLYLALRLAYIEDYADRAEPVPFIGDDIFQTFDDERTASGIAAFASTARLFQPILFTHHTSVVNIARRALGADLDYIEL